MANLQDINESEALAQPEQKEPFTPDWVNYRQGFQDGRNAEREALAAQPAQSAHWQEIQCPNCGELAQSLKPAPAAQPEQQLADMMPLIARLERQWHRMGELWERCQGKGWPEKEDAEFRSLRDEKTPATRAAIEALAAPQPEQKPTQDTLYLLRRLLSNQHTLTGPEFREELAKIVAEAPQRHPVTPLTDEQMAKAWAVADGEHNASASVKRRITRAVEHAHGITGEQS